MAAAAPAHAASWCGTPADADRFPDAVSAYHWHVYYAYPNDGRDRLAEMAPKIVGDVERIAAWWRREDGARAPRFDLFDFPGCSTEFGRLDITRVHLPRPGGEYARTSVSPLVDDVPKSVFHEDKFVLVYYDGSFADGHICGVGRSGAAVIPLGSCGNEIDEPARAAVVAHEMLHGLGAVPPAVGSAGPPNACPGDAGHVCDDPGDVLSRFKGGGLEALALDAGRDDYYGHGGSWWDVRKSLLLEPLDSADRTPPTTPGQPFATSFGGSATFSWRRSDDASPVWYRIYADDGAVADTISGTSFTTSAEIGQVVAYHVRAVDQLGYLSAPVMIRFKVGYGLVDADGRVIVDTVGPSAVSGLRVTLRRGRALIRWRPASDTVGLRGYQVLISGRSYRFVRRTSVAIPLRRAAGRIVSVYAVDGGGNAGFGAWRRVPRR